jgi:hypothetical protein
MTDLVRDLFDLPDHVGRLPRQADRHRAERPAEAAQPAFMLPFSDGEEACSLS